MANQEELQDALEEAKEALQNAIDKCKDLSEICRRSDMKGTTARMEAYILPHLEAWLEDENQCGALPEVENEIEEHFDGEEEDDESEEPASIN